jgi:hypothetical protein
VVSPAHSPPSRLVLPALADRLIELGIERWAASPAGCEPGAGDGLVPVNAAPLRLALKALLPY